MILDSSLRGYVEKNTFDCCACCTANISVIYKLVKNNEKLTSYKKELFCILSLFISKTHGLIDTHEQQMFKQQAAEQGGSRKGP